MTEKIEVLKNDIATLSEARWHLRESVVILMDRGIVSLGSYELGKFLEVMTMLQSWKDLLKFIKEDEEIKLEEGESPNGELGLGGDHEVPW